MTPWSRWKSRLSTVLILAILNVLLAVRSAPPLATLERIVGLAREIVIAIQTPPDTSVVAPPPTVVLPDPEPTTTIPSVSPCFLASAPSQPPTQGCTTVWAVQLVAYNYTRLDIALAALDQLRNEGLTELALVDSSVFSSLCPGHLLLVQPTFGSQEEATVAGPSLRTRAKVGGIDIVPLAPDTALRANPDCT